MSDVEITPEDALQVAQRALSRVNELEDDLRALEGDYDDTVEDLTKIKLRLSEIDDERPYEGLTLDEKVGMVREHAYERAVNGHGRTTLDYKDVEWGPFGGEPGTKHLYKLMRLAAGTDEDEQRDINAGARGFAFREPDGENKQLICDAELAQRGVAFFPEKKDASEGVTR